jgi:hypothetical protein
MANMWRQVDAVFECVDEVMTQVFGPDRRPKLSSSSSSVRIKLGKDQLMALYQGKAVIYRVPSENLAIKIEGDPCST